MLWDEPTNTLDRASRHLLYDEIAAWTGTLIVVSHDEAFLEHLALDARVILDEDGLRPGALPAANGAAAPRSR